MEINFEQPRNAKSIAVTLSGIITLVNPEQLTKAESIDVTVFGIENDVKPEQPRKTPSIEETFEGIRKSVNPVQYAKAFDPIEFKRDEKEMDCKLEHLPKQIQGIEMTFSGSVMASSLEQP